MATSKPIVKPKKALPLHQAIATGQIKSPKSYVGAKKGFK